MGASSLNPFDELLLQTLGDLFRMTHAPVPTRVLADFALNSPERTVRHYLTTRLEKAGLVQRQGQRGGWLPSQRLMVA